MEIAIRVDASTAMGTGHLVRCRTLGRALRQQGATVRFICRAHPGHGIEALREEGFAVAALPEPEPPESETADEDYARWLGVPQARDADETITVLEDRPDWLVVDHYGLDAEWEQRLRPHVGRTLVIDDLANRDHDCDALLDQNYNPDAEARYADRLPAGATRLLGPRYALLGPEYAAHRRELGTHSGRIERVLVFFGGTDPDNLTGRALEALSDPAFTDVAVDAVVGPNNPHREALAKQAEARPGITLHSPRPHLADLMAGADLAIGAGGSTTWERCCLGLPSLVVSIAENQRPACEALAADGLVAYAGHHAQVTIESLLVEISALVSEPERLRCMAAVGWELVDGRGVERVVEVFLSREAFMSGHEGHKWRYERGEGRFKHRWKQDYPGFEPSPRGPVGKCPRHVTDEIAERILNEDAIPCFEAEDSPWPDRFHALYQGAVYETVPTQPGVSYHAYPWRGDLPGRPGLMRSTLRQLRERADSNTERAALESWLKQYGGRNR